MYRTMTSLAVILGVGCANGCTAWIGPSGDEANVAATPNAASADGGAGPDAVSTGLGAILDDTGVSPVCGEAPEEPPSAPPSEQPTDPHPMIRHWEQPREDNVVALTFDDGPSPATTNRILDVLAAENIRATFFINTRSTVDVRSSSEARKTLLRIAAAGHVLGNHTAQHFDLSKGSTDVDAQLRFVEEDLKLVVPCAPRLTLVRAPYGQPYISATDEACADVSAIVARHGVHVGWSIDPEDWTCAGTWCVVDRVLEQFDAGNRGAILLHDTAERTADALPTLIDELRKRGVTFVTAEKLVRDKYGNSSAELLE